MRDCCIFDFGFLGAATLSRDSDRWFVLRRLGFSFDGMGQPASFQARPGSRRETELRMSWEKSTSGALT